MLLYGFGEDSLSFLNSFRILTVGDPSGGRMIILLVRGRLLSIHRRSLSLPLALLASYSTDNGEWLSATHLLEGVVLTSLLTNKHHNLVERCDIQGEICEAYPLSY